MLTRVPGTQEFTRYPLSTTTALVRCNVCAAITDDEGWNAHVFWHVTVQNQYNETHEYVWSRIQSRIAGMDAKVKAESADLVDKTQTETLTMVRDVLKEVMDEAMGPDEAPTKEPRRIKRPVVKKENEA